MAVKTSNTNTKNSSKNYLAKDFSDFRRDLISYAQNYFSDQIRDFSETSVSGMFVELAAYVGDSMSYYINHQFNELVPETAIETRNVMTHARNAGVKVTGAAPAIANVTFYCEVPGTTLDDGTFFPDETAFPVFGTGNILASRGGIQFTLTEELDFGERNSDGVLLCTYTVSATDSSGNPAKYILTKEAECLSGRIKEDVFEISNSFVPFRTITLTQADVTQILSVLDSSGNEYYEVESLAQDTVFKRVQNYSFDRDNASDNLEIIPAPYRYTTSTGFTTRATTLQFGSGDASTTDDDIIPDPSDLALPLYGKKTFSKFSVDPNSLLQTRTLGVSPTGTTIRCTYRHGGGTTHNVGSESIRTISKLDIRFPNNPSSTVQNDVIRSLDVKNQASAAGGGDAPTLEEVRSLISPARNQQNRIVTQQDLLARLYTLPSNFGKVYRAGLRKNEENPLSTELYLLCRDSNRNLVIAPDTLKKNIRIYLNEFRLISDAIDVLDGSVVNYKINFSIVCTPSSNKSSVVSNVINNIKTVSNIKYFQIDQPIVESDVINAIINTHGVLSLVSLDITNIFGNNSGREYSDIEFDMQANLYKGLIVGPPGSMFEIKYPDQDITGTAE